MLNNISNQGLAKANVEQWKELSKLQKRIIKLETKLMFERDRNTKLQIRNKLQELEQRRRDILNA